MITRFHGGHKMTKRILITGGEGFIGKRIQKILQKQGHFVMTADIVDTADIVLDLSYARTELSMHLAKNNIDVVCHMAAKVGGGKYLAEQEWDICKHNATVDLNVLDGFIKARVPTRFIYCSSSMVFQNGFEVCVENDVDSYLIAPPTNNYGFTKLQGERFTEAACKKFGREYIIGRPFNVYGSGEHEDSNDGTAHVIPDVYRRLSDDSSSLYLYGNGKQTRSFTHADDVAKAFAMMCVTENPDCINTTFNVASEENISITNLAVMIARYMSIDINNLSITYKDAWAGDTVQRKPNTSKIRRILGWRPMVPFSTGLRANIDWLLNQRETQ